MGTRVIACSASFREEDQEEFKEEDQEFINQLQVKASLFQTQYKGR